MRVITHYVACGMILLYTILLWGGAPWTKLVSSRVWIASSPDEACLGCLLTRTVCDHELKYAGLTIAAALPALSEKLERACIIAHPSQSSFIIAVRFTASNEPTGTPHPRVGLHLAERCVGLSAPSLEMALLEGLPFIKTNEPWRLQQLFLQLLSSLPES